MAVPKKKKAVTKPKKKTTTTKTTVSRSPKGSSWMSDEKSPSTRKVRPDSAQKKTVYKKNGKVKNTAYGVGKIHEDYGAYVKTSNATQKSANRISKAAGDRATSKANVKQSVTKSSTNKKGTKSKTYSMSTDRNVGSTKSKTNRKGKTKTKAVSTKKVARKYNKAAKKGK